MAESAEHDSNGPEATDRLAGGAGHPTDSLSILVIARRLAEISRGSELNAFRYFVRLRTIFHTQLKLLNVPSNVSSVNFPRRCWKPIVAPNAPSSRTVP